MCPPRLLFVPDRDGDDVPDGPPEVVLDGFDVPPENYHNFANGLRWGPDGWLYGRCGASAPGEVRRPGDPPDKAVAAPRRRLALSPRAQGLRGLCHGTTNPWGHDWTPSGEGFFINTVNGHLWHLIPGAHYQPSAHHRPQSARLRADRDARRPLALRHRQGLGRSRARSRAKPTGSAAATPTAAA